jgi:hypothetical protein
VSRPFERHEAVDRGLCLGPQRLEDVRALSRWLLQQEDMKIIAVAGTVIESEDGWDMLAAGASEVLVATWMRCWSNVSANSASSPDLWAGDRFCAASSKPRASAALPF